MGHAEAEARIVRHLDGGELAEAATLALSTYGPQIRGYLGKILADEMAAADVFAEFSEDLWKGLATFRRESSFRTWAYRLAFNAALMYKRDPYRRRVRPILTGEYSQLADRLRQSSARIDPLAADRLAKLRASLTPDEHTLLILRIDKELTWDEIAGVLADTDARAEPATLRKRFERLKERLVKMAVEEGLG